MLDARGVELKDGDLVMRAADQPYKRHILLYGIVLCDRIFGIDGVEPKFIENFVTQYPDRVKPTYNVSENYQVVRIDNLSADEVTYRRVVLKIISEIDTRKTKFVSKDSIIKAKELLEG